MKIFKQILKILIVIVFMAMLAICMRVFLFSIFTIPTSSMEPTIISGDRVVVNKLIPGPRIITNFFSRERGRQFEYTRLAGWRDIKRNDILVFNYPYSNWDTLKIDPNKYYSKRCLAIPKDTFFIENGIYKVRGVSDTIGNYWTQKEFATVPKDQIDQVIYNCFPFNSKYNWNVKNFGPIYVPAKGDTLEISLSNIVLYQKLIAYETNTDIQIVNDKVLLKDSVIEKYVFKKNYYFVGGDMVQDSQDSRYWGLLPEDHIEGKVSFVYKSVNPVNREIRWNRFFKSVK